MTLRRLIDELQYIADHLYKEEETEVYVENWDDNVYDGNKIEGIRLVKEIDFEKDERKIKLFFTHS